MRFFKDASYPFIEARKKAYVLSAAVLLSGIAAMVINVATIGSWQDYGVDFTGGSLIQVEFNAPITASELRDALGGAQAPPITRFGDEDERVVDAIGRSCEDALEGCREPGLVDGQAERAAVRSLAPHVTKFFLLLQNYGFGRNQLRGRVRR